MNQRLVILENLLVECMERHEKEGPDSVQELLAQNPEHATSLRRYLRFLDNLEAPLKIDQGQSSPPPAILGDFQLIELIGSGGMGEVWLADQVTLSRRCALKIIRSNNISKHAMERFRLEAKALARIQSPYVVDVFASGVVDSIAYLAMAYVEGQGLDRVLKQENPRPLRDYVEYARDVARALIAVHDADLIHRDIKPSNILITKNHKAILIDFGLVRELATPAASLSVSGSFVGTPYYAAPEQLSGVTDEIGPWTDVYGLGVCLYECATRNRPFDGQRPDEVFRHILTTEPTPANELAPEISPALARVITKAMEKDPDHRYSTAEQFADDLDAVLELRPVSVRPANLARRTAKWAKRHPMVASIVAATLIIAVLVTTTLAIRDITGRKTRAKEAKAAVATALQQLQEFSHSQSENAKLLTRRAEIIYLLPYRHLTQNERAELDLVEHRLEDLEGRLEHEFFDMLELLRRAERLDPQVKGVEGARARIYLEKWRAANADRNLPLSSFYRQRVLESDPKGQLLRALEGGTTVKFTTDPPEAEVHLFRIQTHAEIHDDGQFRNVAVPHAWFDHEGKIKKTKRTETKRLSEPHLRLVREHEQLPAETHITAVGTRVLTEINISDWRDQLAATEAAQLIVAETTHSVEQLSKLEVRPTLRPLLIGSDSQVTNKAQGMVCSNGHWLMVVRHKGYQSRRGLITINRSSGNEIEVTLSLNLLNEVPPWLCPALRATFRFERPRHLDDGPGNHLL